MDPDPTPFFSDFKDAKKKFHIFFLQLTRSLKNLIFCQNFCKHYFSPLNSLMRKGKDPDLDPYFWSGSGMPKNMRIRILNTGCLFSLYNSISYHSIMTLACQKLNVLKQDLFVLSRRWLVPSRRHRGRRRGLGKVTSLRSSRTADRRLGGQPYTPPPPTSSGPPAMTSSPWTIIPLFRGHININRRRDVGDVIACFFLLNSFLCHVWEEGWDGCVWAAPQWPRAACSTRRGRVAGQLPPPIPTYVYSFKMS